MPTGPLRRRKGKSDSLDAEATARAALAGLNVVTPKRQDGRGDAAGVAGRAPLGEKARIQSGNQLLGLLARASPTALDAAGAT